MRGPNGPTLAHSSANYRPGASLSNPCPAATPRGGCIFFFGARRHRLHSTTQVRAGPMGDAAHLRVRGGVTVILWRQEGTRMQAFACTAQHVSWEKMGSCCQQKPNSTCHWLCSPGQMQASILDARRPPRQIRGACHCDSPLVPPLESSGTNPVRTRCDMLMGADGPEMATSNPH